MPVKKRPGSKRVRSIYWKNCSVCQFMKNNPQFRYEVMHSSYFDPEGHQTLSDVIHKWGEPVKLTTVYMHMARHQADDLIVTRKKYKAAAAADPDHPTNLVQAVEGEVESRAEHELALDAYIHQGYEKISRKEMPMSAANFIAALKIKADMDKGTKDRRADMVKAFFLKKDGK